MIRWNRCDTGARPERSADRYSMKLTMRSKSSSEHDSRAEDMVLVVLMMRGDVYSCPIR